MPYRFHEPHSHHIEKMRFKVTNWSAYDEGFRNRGSLTSWIEEVVLQSWYAARRTTPGGQPVYADGTIKMIHEHGRMAWRKATNYGRRSLVETAFGRYKSMMGDSLSARGDDGQMTEAAIGIKALNRMTRTAKPISVRV